MILPCKHQASITRQVEPTIDLLMNLDDFHPDILIQHNIIPQDYKKGLVFRSAIESIRGSFIASSTLKRQSFVGSVLQELASQSLIDGFRQTSSTSRTDFELSIAKQGGFYAGLEVKGGEGNSINISDRPLWAKEFYIWSHLDGAIVTQPNHDAHSIVNRISNEMCKRQKLVDALFIKDVLCGTRARPCPKYPGQEENIGLGAAPDVLLFPQRIPSLDDPEPPVHTLTSLVFPAKMLDFFQVLARAAEHLWFVHIKLEQASPTTVRRIVEVEHKGQVVDVSKSRPWAI